MNDDGREDSYFKLIGLFLAFLIFAFNQDLALIYIAIMVVDYWWYKSDNFISFPLSRGRQTNTRVYLEAVIGLALFLGLSTVLAKAVGVQSLFQLLSAATPVLKDSRVLTVLGWGVLVPIIETRFWNGRLLDGFATYAQLITKKPVTLTKASGMLGLVIVFVGLLFVLFHIAGKGTTNAPLLVTFLFSVISSLMVLRHKELKGAVLMHILLNTAAVLSLPLFQT